MALRHEEDCRMPRKRHEAEEIVAKLRQVDVLVSQGKPVAEAVRSIAVTEVTYYRWRQEYGGHCHVVARRTRKACVLHIFKRPRLPRAKCSSPWRESLGAWRLMRGGVGRRRCCRQLHGSIEIAGLSPVS